jgi:hypothetical protein
MEQITISGHAFNVPVRYEEGHELTAGEASALNQTYHENLRNNFAKKVKDAGGSPDLASLQTELDTYASDYQFGVRVAGVGVSRDPVMAEAMRIAKKQVSELIKKAGKKPSDYEPAAISTAAKGLIDKDSQILAIAKSRVAEQQALAGEDVGDLLSSLTPKAPAAVAA